MSNSLACHRHSLRIFALFCCSNLILPNTKQQQQEQQQQLIFANCPVFLTGVMIQRGDLSLEGDLVCGGSARVPEPDASVKVSTDDSSPHAPPSNHIVAAGTSKQCLGT